LGGKRAPDLGVKAIKVKAGPGLIIEINLGESIYADLGPNGDKLVNCQVRTARVLGQEGADVSIHVLASLFVPDHIPGGEIGAANYGGDVEQLRSGLLGEIRVLSIGVVGRGANDVGDH